ncbi:uncharacterized protein LOC115981038 [Quercus lobata]|uniref:uncharacterized protein LOC115981038 n=1 Tax=Quercus lobata TaxID=97700 RepID=UPI0012461809|nr:uncharacterized protein LOC115981038 [Quercus lobata]
MKPPKTKKDIRGFLGRMQYISRFIAQLIMTCEPIFRLLKKEVPTVWNEQCQEAFEKIKSYLMKPPILVPPALENPLSLYLTTTDIAIGALLTQYLEETRKENAIYYISKKMMPYEENLQGSVDCKNGSFEVFNGKTVQDGKTVKWVLLLSKFDIKYVTQKFVKGRAIANHLAHCSPEETEEIQEDFSDEDTMEIEVESWKIYFDGVTNQNESGIGVLLISPKKAHILFSGRLNFPAINNATKYETCIMGLQATLSLGVKGFEVYGDSTLIISQVQNKWKIKEERLMPYHQCLQKWSSKFSKIQYQYVPRMQNQIADALVTMTSMMDEPKEDEARLIVLEQKKEPAYYIIVEEDEGKDGEGEWYSDTLKYLKDGT